MSNTFEVQANVDEVAKALRDELSPDEYAMIAIKPASAPAADPFAIDRRHDLPDIRTIVEFTAAAVASGVVYDVIKKITVVLERTFSGRFKKDDDGKA